MKNHIDLEWSVSDGYAGGSRPQATRLSLEEILECETDEEAIRLAEDAVQEDFQEKVTWSGDIAKQVLAARREGAE